MVESLTFYEFFAGGGMARLGLGPRWRCLLANDIEPAKAEVYRANFGGEELRVGDVWDLEAADLPGQADLAWASFPCQDMSLAGRRAGLAGERSGSFYGFWRLVEALAEEGRAPRTVLLENVPGVLTSHSGRDFEAIVSHLRAAGYHYTALEIDASLFTPQSRQRVFIIGSQEPFPAALTYTDEASLPFAGRDAQASTTMETSVPLPPRGGGDRGEGAVGIERDAAGLRRSSAGRRSSGNGGCYADRPLSPVPSPTRGEGRRQSPSLETCDRLSRKGKALPSDSSLGWSVGVAVAVDRLPPELRREWRWLRLPSPPRRNTTLDAIVETNLPPRAWHTPAASDRLLHLMSERHRARLEELRKLEGREVGTIYRRMRPAESASGGAQRVQRAEIRFDGVAGCLRTPQGGSSRQFLIVVEDGTVRTRPMTPRETARLMGLGDDYQLPDRATAALKVTGDGVVVPVVAWLGRHVLEPLLTPAVVEAA
jgi:DNA-cytosine methyltransferase